MALTLGSAAFLVLAGFVAGFIDSIAGGGGLVTLPSLAWILGPGVLAIGTNKIVGSVAALVALLVYASKGHFDLSKSLAFAVWVGLGSFAGAMISPYIPSSWFPFFLAATCPIILWIVWNKDLWVAREGKHAKGASSAFDGTIILSGLACGLYDGAWGPGGGTFMFLALFFYAKLPLLVAIAASKLANTASATASLVSYAAQGLVHPLEGLVMTSGVVFGSYIGARNASARAAKIVRPALAAVSVLLILKLCLDLRH